jgi:hypothetical protein
MKILTLSTILAAAVLSFASCNKQYDTEVSDSQNNNNGGGSSAPVFNWTGTAPLSVKFNGIPFVADDISFTDFTKVGTPFYGVSGHCDTAKFSLSIPSTVVPGQVYSFPMPVNMTHEDSEHKARGAFKGKMKIITNNATTLEAYFYLDLKDLSGLNGNNISVTEGYFKIEKE